MYFSGWSSVWTERRFSPGNQAGAARDRPTLENAIHLKPQVIMQAASVMLLDHEAVALSLATFRLRLARDGEVSLRLVGGERTGGLWLSGGLGSGPSIPGFQTPMIPRP